MSVVSVANQKGGCGKTTTAVNLSWSLTRLDETVLLVDLDPQGHASIGLGFDTDLLDRTVRDCLVRPAMPIGEVFLPFSEKLHVVPAGISLASLEQELAGEPERELRLRQALAGPSREYDRIVIDSPPSPGFLTIHAPIAAHAVTTNVRKQRLIRSRIDRSVSDVEPKEDDRSGGGD